MEEQNYIAKLIKEQITATTTTQKTNKQSIQKLPTFSILHFFLYYIYFFITFFLILFKAEVKVYVKFHLKAVHTLSYI